MKLNQINIRDPYIMVYNDRYYMYGTRSCTCWSTADGFDCFTSSDLIDWEGPIEIFKKPEGFFAAQCYWAPECYHYNGSFYLVTTFAGDYREKGIYILKSHLPEGPFSPYGQCLTPNEWSCIDGTLYFEDGHPYLIFSHSFEDNPDGDMCLLQLTDDLSSAAGVPPSLLFSAAETPWAKPVPFAKEEMGIDSDIYFADGPSVIRHPNGSLCMAWSSWGTNGYAVGLAIAGSGKITGSWKQSSQLLFPENGGHGMFFTARDGQLYYLLHYPNDKFKERPCLKKVLLEETSIRLV